MLKLGFCNICQTQQIWTMEKGKNKPNEFYCELTFAVSDGRIATHAVCINCFTLANDKRVEELFDKIKNYWREEMVGWANEKQFAKMEQLSFVKGTVAADTKESEAKYLVIVEKERKKMLKDKQGDKKDAD